MPLYERYHVEAHCDLSKLFSSVFRLPTKKTLKFRITDCLLGGMHRRFSRPPHKGPVMLNAFQYYGVIMASSMGPTWVLSAPDGPHVGPMNHAIRECFSSRECLSSSGWFIQRVMLLWRYIALAMSMPARRRQAMLADRSKPNMLRAEQNGRHFENDVFKCISFSENLRNLITIWLKLYPVIQMKLNHHWFR